MGMHVDSVAGLLRIYHFILGTFQQNNSIPSYLGRSQRLPPRQSASCGCVAPFYRATWDECPGFTLVDISGSAHVRPKRQCRFGRMEPNHFYVWSLSMREPRGLYIATGRYQHRCAGVCNLPGLQVAQDSIRICRIQIRCYVHHFVTRISVDWNTDSFCGAEFAPGILSCRGFNAVCDLSRSVAIDLCPQNAHFRRIFSSITDGSTANDHGGHTRVCARDERATWIRTHSSEFGHPSDRAKPWCTGSSRDT
mmetsp:Transcript_1749/g.3836  ORF Transcript_1749/g.3836 Transcript_1749/m.3836 type:complete len:251 (-) Transcript_1749:1134-1886(-)